MNRRPDATDKHVRQKRVRMRRLMLKMSQEEIAERLGLTYQQLQKYETGANRVSAGGLLERLMRCALLSNFSLKACQGLRANPPRAIGSRLKDLCPTCLPPPKASRSPWSLIRVRTPAITASYCPTG